MLTGCVGSQVTESGARLVEALSRVNERGETRHAGLELLETAYRALSNQYDAVHGGFGRAPKFPQPVTLELVLRYHLRTGDPSASEMLVHTLRQDGRRGPPRSFGRGLPSLLRGRALARATLREDAV